MESAAFASTGFLYRTFSRLLVIFDQGKTVDIKNNADGSGLTNAHERSSRTKSSALYPFVPSIHQLKQFSKKRIERARKANLRVLEKILDKSTPKVAVPNNKELL